MMLATATGRTTSRITLWRDSCMRDPEAPLVCDCLAKNGVFAPGSPKSDFLKGWPEELDGELLDLASLLFENVESGDVNGILCIVEACKAQFGAKTAVALLSARRADDGNEFPLGVAAALGDVTVIETLVEQGCCLACQNNCNESALHTAAMLGRVEAVQVLLDNGLDVLLHTPHAEIGDVIIDRVLGEITETASEDAAHAETLELVAEQLLAAGATSSQKVLDVDLAVFSKRLANIIVEQQHKHASSQLSQQLSWRQEEVSQSAVKQNQPQVEVEEKEQRDGEKKEMVVVITPSSPNFAIVPPKTESPKKKSFTTTRRLLKQPTNFASEQGLDDEKSAPLSSSTTSTVTSTAAVSSPTTINDEALPCL